MPRKIVAITLGAVALTACSEQASEPVMETALVTYTEERAVCADRNPNRNAYFGDLHIHTGFSYDARPFGTDLTPADAYAFAKGEAIGIPPYDDDGNPSSMFALKKPLDFAAVTDHAEYFGELTLCTDATSDVYDTPLCESLRGDDDRVDFAFFEMILNAEPARIPELCGEDGAACAEAASPLWQATQDMAEADYDRTEACSFTTFVAYEYTGTPNSSNMHRNVIFRNAQVPARALSYVDAPTDVELWAGLTDECLEGTPGCDVLAIPHNSNISAGVMFPSYVARYESEAEGRTMAIRRNAMEPIMEVFQHKGNSECFNGFPDILGETDELCNEEQALSTGTLLDRNDEPYEIRLCEENETGTRGFARRGCISKRDFYRSVLLTGLEDMAALGVNSYTMGVIASTDTHIGLSGHTDEQSWVGHLVDETTLDDRLQDYRSSPRNISGNPGGLAGVWAVENGRDALFDAMQRREVFGTSGTRITPRFFGGWDYSEQVCGGGDLVAEGYAKGTPMGGTLDSRPGDGAPTFIAMAAQDPDAAQLQKLQIIKGWIDGGGRSRYKVIDVAGQDNEAGTVNIQTGAWSGTGDASLCAVFEDPEFNPAEPAYYYLRAVEVPTLRWSWAQCVSLPAAERPDACDNEAPKTVHELAWTSPIWYLPSE